VTKFSLRSFEKKWLTQSVLPLRQSRHLSSQPDTARMRGSALLNYKLYGNSYLSSFHILSYTTVVAEIRSVGEGRDGQCSNKTRALNRIVRKSCLKSPPQTKNGCAVLCRKQNPRRLLIIKHHYNLREIGETDNAHFIATRIASRGILRTIKKLAR